MPILRHTSVNRRFTFPVISRALLILAVLLIHHNLQASMFGRNTVQYTYFQWEYLTTEHFNIYYNQGGREVADFAAEVAEEAFRKIARTFQYSAENDDPIVMVTYQSHNDFEQTNITSQPDESTGGVTEFLKTRIIVPFQGDHEEFRHVIHHELTHAMMLNMLYGQGFSAIMAGMSRTRMPLWFIEGLAEYMSRDGLDIETEMFLRDAVVNDILPEISQREGYGYLGVYKCGQSILYWIAWRYGDEKIGEILHQIKNLGSFDRALKVSIGIDSEELSKKWRRFIKERYWPLVGKMEPPDHFSQQLTDHEKDYCFVNNSPALSPNGEWLAFLSNRSDYFDVYLMNTLDGKVVKRLIRGQRSGKFEELHWLRPGITWSPDGKKIALCAKAGRKDALYIISIPNGKISQKLDWKSDGLFSPSWSPDGRYIALVLIHDGQSDIVTVDLETGKLHHVTEDVFDEADPSWSPDGDRILFTSNRGDIGLDEPATEETNIFEHEYDHFDVYDIELETRRLRRITNDSFNEHTPLWTPIENTILYVSDLSGIYNIYLHNLESGAIYSLTNIVTGIFQPTIAPDVGTMAFASFFNNGYDIFLQNDPFSEKNRATVLSVPVAEKIKKDSKYSSNLGLSSLDYHNFVFDRLFHEDDEITPEDSTLSEQRTRLPDGKYPSREYEVQLQPDLFFINASYGPYYLFQGSGMILFSDVLGNHQLYISLDLNSYLKYSILFLMYSYLAHRVDIAGGTYHYAYPFYSGSVIWLDRNYGLFVSAAYPLNRFDRIDFGFDLATVERSEYTDFDYPDSKLTSVVPHIGYVHDTSIWRWSTSPGNGGRWRVDLSWSPDISSSTGQGISFQTLSADWRRYFVYHKDYTFAFRLSGATSEGRDQQRFFLGGMMNWFNSRFDNPKGRVEINMKDIYFSRFVTPLRGTGYYNQIGTRYILGNFEFRFPFIRHLLFGWPLPIYFRNVRGAFFTDVGAAWDPRYMNRKLFPSMNEWSSGFGFGIRLNLGIFPIEWDLAWSEETNMAPQYYFSLNFGF